MVRTTEDGYEPLKLCNACSSTRKKPRFDLGDLSGPEGNAFSIMGRWKVAAREAGWTSEEIKKVLDDAMNGDYDHLLQTIKDASD